MTDTRAGMIFGKRSFAFFSAAFIVLSGCEEGGEFNLFQPKADGDAQAPRSAAATRLVERDVEVPDVFQVTEQGLWDGRPSLGGVWVAHPEVTDPERVIIRNTANGKFVIGALFRRERENPGPLVQVSSDAAAALGMLAGSPQQLNITALRRETASEDAPAEDVPTEDAPEADFDAPDAVEATPLDTVTGAAAAIDAAEAAQPTASPAPAPAPTPAASPRASSLAAPFIQIGIFSVEENADNTATAMRQAGMVPTVKQQSASGKSFWRVVVGPATSTSERDQLIKKIKDMGFTDAYAVSN